MNRSNTDEIGKGLLLLMTTAVSATAANLYFNQPILPQIGADLGISGDALGSIPAASQFGYALALLLISPLGDSIARKRLIAVLSMMLVVASAIAVTADSLLLLVICCFVIGLSANITQQLIPFAATLASEESKGRVIATLMTGLTLGIVLSRTLSGYVGDHFGWRAVFVMSALLALLFAMLLQRFLPDNTPSSEMPYRQLLMSMVTLAKQHKLLRQSALAGALWFAAFSALLSTLALHVNEPPFNYSAQQAGMFGFIALAGVIGAKLSAIWVSKIGARHVISLALVLAIIGFVISACYGNQLLGLIAGIMLIDFGVFCAQVANQVRVFSIDAQAQSRINGVYMLAYYVGGALGSLLGVMIFAQYAWPGVALLSVLLIIASLWVNAGNPKARCTSDRASMSQSQ